MSFKYIYSIEKDFPNSKVDTEALVYEIRESSITIALDYVFISNEIECHIFMKAELVEDEHLILNQIVSQHTGEPLPGVQQSNTVDVTRIINENNKCVDVDDRGRMKVLSFVTPQEHELSGPQHTGRLSSKQLPDCVARCTDLTALSGTLTQNMYDFAEEYYDKPEIDLFLKGKAPLAHDHDLRYYKKPEIDDLIITDHNKLSGLSNDDHLQYLNVERGDDRYFTKISVYTISGSLQNDIDSKSDSNHIHDDRYYTEEEVNSKLSSKSDLSHTHLHKDLDGLSEDDHPQYLLANGKRHVDGDLIIFGNLSVSGTQFITNTEIVEIQDNLLLINNGEQGPGVSSGLAGIEIDRGTEPSYRFIFDEVHDAFKAGASGTEDTVALVQDFPITEGYVPYWVLHNNDVIPHYELSIKDSLHINNIASKDFVNSTAISLQQNIDTKADLRHTHVESDITNLVHDAVKIHGRPIDKPQPEDDGKRIIYNASENKFELRQSGSGGGGESFPFSYFYRVASPEKVSTTAYEEKWYEKTKLVVNVPEGTYRIGWYYQWLCTSTSRSIIVNLFEDGVDLHDYRFDGILYSEVEPKDYRCYYTDSGFRYIELDEGEHTFRLRFQASRHGAVVYMWNTEIEFWRVG